MSPEVKGAAAGAAVGVVIDLLILAYNGTREATVENPILNILMVPVFLALAGAIAGGVTRK